jgi:hypothetical protein
MYRIFLIPQPHFGQNPSLGAGWATGALDTTFGSVRDLDAPPV